MSGGAKTPIARRGQNLPSGKNYDDDPDYIDNVTGAHLDLLSGAFWVDHRQRGVVYLDYDQLRIEILGSRTSSEPRTFGLIGGTSLKVIYQRYSNGLIYPSKFHDATTPNIAAFLRDIEKQKNDRIETLLSVKLVITVFGVAGGGAATSTGTASRSTAGPKANRLRQRSVKRLGQPAKSPPTIPKLKQAPAREMLREAVKHVKNHGGDTAAKADLMEAMVEQIQQSNPGWKAIRWRGVDGSEIFFGRVQEMFLVIGPKGRIFKGQYMKDCMTTTPTGGFKPIYSKMQEL